MEKFTKWADKSGINPFLPARPVLPKNILAKGANVLLGTLLFIFRLPILLCLSVLYVFARLAIMPVVMVGIGASIVGFGGKIELGGGIAAYGFVALLVPLARRILLRLVDMSLLRMALLSLGVHFGEVPANLRRLGLRTPDNKSLPPMLMGATRSGDLLVCNYTSFVEVIYLQHAFSPVFTSVAVPESRADRSRVTLTSVNFFVALYRALCKPPLKDVLKKTADKQQSLAEIVKVAARRRQGPVVVFPEAARTNGDAVLRFTCVLDDDNLPSEMGTHLLMFSHRNCKYPSCHPVGSFFSKLFWICFQFSTTVHVLYVTSEDTPKPPSQQTKKTTGVTIKRTVPWSLQLWELVSSGLGNPKVELDCWDFLSFWEYYDLLSKDKKAAAKLADKRKKY